MFFNQTKRLFCSRLVLTRHSLLLHFNQSSLASGMDELSQHCIPYEALIEIQFLNTGRWHFFLSSIPLHSKISSNYGWIINVKCISTRILWWMSINWETFWLQTQLLTFSFYFVRQGTWIHKIKLLFYLSSTKKNWYRSS